MVRPAALLASLLAATVAVATTACGGGGGDGGPGIHPPLATGSPTAPPSPSPTPIIGETPTPTSEATPTAGATGSPFSLSDLTAAWEAQGMTVTTAGAGTGFSGFAVTAFDASVVRDGETLDLSVLVYADREVIKEDWELTVGEPAEPKEGRSLPDHVATWWNENVAVVVRSSTGGIGSDALDAFLALGGPSASPTPTPTPSS